MQGSELAFPPDAKMGDISLPCFVIAKQTGANPAQVATSLAEALAGKTQELGLASVTAMGPYLNFSIDKAALAAGLFAEIDGAGKDYGHNDSGGGQKTMVEYSNVNTHKEYHVGHLRNLCFGDAVQRLMLANGFQSIPVSYINDFGIHVAKTIWALEEYYKGQELPENKGAFLGSVYVRASKEMKEKPELKEPVGKIMQRIESRQGEIYVRWQETREWSIAQFARIYEDMGIELKKTYYESETIDRGREMVDEMLKKGILRKSDGAVIADFTERDLGVLVVLRSDGTATYPVADLPLAMKKFDEYDLDASIYVVDIRQSLYFKQLFALMKEMGYKKTMIHLGYDFVTLPGGMMSSRSGNVVTYEEFKEMLTARISEETSKRHPDWDAARVEAVVKVLFPAIIKFEMLKIGAQQPITFEIEKAIAAQGFSAVYLAYTAARISSIERKAEAAGVSPARTSYAYSEKQEEALLMKLAKYPAAVKEAGRDFDPSTLCKYLFELAQDFNDYYHAVTIMNSGDDAQPARLRLALAVRQVLGNGLGLLGIGTVEEM